MTPRRRTATPGALLLFPGAGSSASHPSLVAIEDAAGAVAGEPGRLPVPARGAARARPRPQAPGVRGGGGRPAGRGRGGRPVTRPARRSLHGRAHVLDGRGGRPARGGPGADQLPPPPARQARPPAHRAPARAAGPVPVPVGHPRRLRDPRGARAPHRGHPRPGAPTCGSRARATTSRVRTRSSPTPWPPGSGRSSRSPRPRSPCRPPRSPGRRSPGRRSPAARRWPPGTGPRP